MKEKFVIYSKEGIDKARKKAERREKFQEKVITAKDWVYNNKEILVVAVPGLIGAGTAIVKVVGKRFNLAKEQKLKENYCYDRSLGHYWALKRELSNKEWVEVDKRKQNGERLADILDSLKVLK